MRMTNFQAPGLDMAIKYIMCEIMESTERLTLAKDILKTTNVTFSLEGLTRYQSTLLCELRDSYTQQSQRYVSMDNSSFDELDSILNNNETLINTARDILNSSIELYQKMSILKDEYSDFKGRKNKLQYKHSIPIEDARYCLPLLCKTNIHVTTTGDKLLDILNLIYKKFGLLDTYEVFSDLYKFGLLNLLYLSYGSSASETLGHASRYHAQIFDEYKETGDDVILVSKFENPNINVAIAAATSGSPKTPSSILSSWGNDEHNEANKLTDRVMGYGHTSIIEHARTTCIFKMSLSAYHQFIRHRLTSNYREPLINLTNSNNGVYVPKSINESNFVTDYLDLFKKFHDFRRVLTNSGYNEDVINHFLLNGDMLKVISSSNCRSDNHIMRDRLCYTAQEEIRELFEKKINILKNIYSPNFIKDAIPQCVSSKCKEGKMSCGKQSEMINKYKEVL